MGLETIATHFVSRQEGPKRGLLLGCVCCTRKWLGIGNDFPTELLQAVPYQRCMALGGLFVSCFALINNIGGDSESTYKSNFKKIRCRLL